MVRPATLRNMPFMRSVKVDVGTEVKPIPFWSPPRGLDYQNPSSRVDPQHMTESNNLILDRGKMISRHGVEELGSLYANAVQIMKFRTSDGTTYIIRFSTDVIDYWDGSAWVTLPGTGAFSFTGGVTHRWAWTGFGDRLVFSNGVNGMYQFDPSIGTTTLITGGPSCKYLTTFNGRIVASDVLFEGKQEQSRIQWSVKNNSEDWDGLGSGFEDLLSTPSGTIDAQKGVWPLSDSTAIILRTDSTWQMAPTGDPDAPFAFTRLYAGLGTNEPHSFAAVPGAVVGLFNDGIYMISDTAIEPIGLLVNDHIIAAITAGLTSGTYLSLAREYALCDGATDVYRYSFEDKGWSRSSYGRTIRWLDSGRTGTLALTWDDVVGTWDAQTLTWDEMVGGSDSINEIIGVDSAGYAFYSDPAAIDDDIATVATAVPIEARTGLVTAEGSLTKTRIIEVQMEYVSGGPQTLIFEYSNDDGATWVAYSTLTVATTAGPDVLSVRHEFVTHKLLFRVRSATLGLLQIISLVAFCTSDAMVKH